MTVQSNLVMITGTLDASLELGSSSFEVTLSFHAENSDLVFMVEDLEISNLFEAVGDAVGLTSEQSETLGDIFSFGGTTFDLAIANGYNVFSHWPSSWPDTLSNQMVVPGLTVRSAASLKEIVTVNIFKSFFFLFLSKKLLTFFLSPSLQNRNYFLPLRMFSQLRIFQVKSLRMRSASL